MALTGERRLLQGSLSCPRGSGKQVPPYPASAQGPVLMTRPQWVRPVATTLPSFPFFLPLLHWLLVSTHGLALLPTSCQAS